MRLESRFSNFRWADFKTPELLNAIGMPIGRNPIVISQVLVLIEVAISLCRRGIEGQEREEWPIPHIASHCRTLRRMHGSNPDRWLGQPFLDPGDRFGNRGAGVR
jgi:hypothetical protein